MHNESSMAVILCPLLVTILGALTFAFTANAKVQKLALVAYAVGLLWLVYDVATRVVRF